MKIAISGIGGVGGYFGGLLAKEYQNSTEVEIYFIARGENEKAIQDKGLELQTNNETFIVHPKLTTSNTLLIGAVDLLISCTKGYDLEENLAQCAPCIDAHTVILPLQNGVDGFPKIHSLYPTNTILDGCVYLVSRLVEPGIIKESGKSSKLFFGLRGEQDEKLKIIEQVFSQAGINVTLSENIEQVIWEKFVFISSLATLTSYYDNNIGSILADPDKKALLELLLTEISALAVCKKIQLPTNNMQTTLAKIEALPFETTSSMHSDFQKQKRTELESLTGYVIQEAKACDLEVPTFETMYQFLKNKEKKI